MEIIKEGGKKLDKKGEENYQVCTWFLKLLDLAAQSNHNGKRGLAADCLCAALSIFNGQQLPHLIQSAYTSLI